MSGSFIPGPKARLRSYGRILAMCTVGISILIATICAGLPLYVFPQTDSTDEVDAVFVLGPVTAPTIEIAEAISKQNGGVPILLSTLPADSRSSRLTSVCAEDHVFCRVADPFTTKGEVRLANGVSAVHGWKTIAVVANVAQVTRARYVFNRCYAGESRIVSSGLDGSALDWARRYVYQTAAFVKAVSTGCS